jgi:hypothetical protein
MKGAVRRRALMGMAVAACLIAVLIFCIHEPVLDRSQLMPATSILRDDNIIEASVGIDCPVEDVFKYYRNFREPSQLLGRRYGRRADRSGNFSMDNTGPPGHSNEMDNKSDRGAPERADPL